VVIAKLRYLFPANSLTPPSRGIIHASNIGLLFTVIGLLTVVLSARRYLIVQQQIRQGRYQASGNLILGFAAVVVLLGLLIIWYLIESSRVG
jgi:putative membrane protein